MRLLFVAPRLPCLPCYDPARLVAAHLVDRLARSHAVAVVTASSGADTPAQHAWLAERATLVDTVPSTPARRPWSTRPTDDAAALEARVRDVARRFQPDVIHLEGATVAPLARSGIAPSLLACHEFAALRARDVRRGGDSAWRRLAARIDEHAETTWARAWFGAADVCVVDSEDDRRALAAHVPLERIEIIGRGIDDVAYAYRRAGEPARLVFTGDLSAPRDVDAARRLAGAILPRVRRDVPRAELLLAGPGRVADAVRALAALPGVRVSGGLADLRPSVWSGAAYVGALDSTFGRTTRLLEPMALGTPVVASCATLAGMRELVAGHHVLAADGDEEFALAILRVLREPRLANTLARAARELVERRFTWRASVQRYEALYARMAPARAVEAVA
jgi:glycosyltransferase involved in cell wall biosynthesis